MPFRFFSSDATAVLPSNSAGGVDLFKLALLGAAGWVWDKVAIGAQWCLYDPTLHLVWIFWCLDMGAGTAASMVRGLKPPCLCEHTDCPLRATCDRAQCNHVPITGMAAFSPRLARIGCGRLLFWSVLIWACHELRMYASPITGLASGTVEVYSLIALFCSFWRNLSRLAGDKRGEQAATTLEDKTDSLLGIHKEGK